VNVPTLQNAVAVPLMLDLRAASKYSGLSYWTVRDLILSGLIPRVPLPNRKGERQRRIWVMTRDLDEFFTRQRERNVEPFRDSTGDSRCRIARQPEQKRTRTAVTRTATEPRANKRRGISAETPGVEVEQVTE
jgi:hypothetical protein